MSGAIRLSDKQIADRLTATVPHASAWVSANAGAGKTTLLRDRVIRMLLEGIAPDRILCLTYTRAAAAEMQNRIFDELALWGVLSEPDLTSKIQHMLGPAQMDGREAIYLRRARQLFAEAVETPGGLKIQTIHAFAERLLHLFPIEAGVPVDFTVLEDEEAANLRADARRQVLEAAVAQPQSRLGRAFSTLLDATGHDGFSTALDEALTALQRLDARDGILPDHLESGVISHALSVPPDLSEDTLEERFLSALPGLEECAAMADALEEGVPGKMLVETIDKLRQLLAASDRAARVDAALSLVLKADGRSTKGLYLSKAIEKTRPDVLAQADRIRAAADDFLEIRLSLRAARKSEALHCFAAEVFRQYHRKKAERGVLDFADLIVRLRRLLTATSAAWVMMKLDAAIEHILLDEAQDTTAEMWDIVEALADDFFSGEGQVKRIRSLFVVGDEKQSIFSFQGAEPRVFDEKRQLFARRISGKAGPENLVANPVRLNASFRSSQDILAMVDRVFQPENHRAGLSADKAPPFHEAARHAFPGLIEFWPLEDKLDEGQDSHDQFGVGSAEARLSRRIAATISGWLTKGERHLSDGSLVGAGDVLVLAQKRGSFVPRLLRDMARLGVPVAGADRLRINEEIGVQDLLAAAQAALLPADDLTLATVLKSPLFGIDDATLESLCRTRERGLRSEIAQFAEKDRRFLAIDARLAALETQVHQRSPYAFLAGLLSDPVALSPGTSGRRAMLARLGVNAADAIDALLTDALAFERWHPPSVAIFLAAQTSRNREIKREMDQAEGRVRVMTVHAAKGLEAPIVILADATRAPSRTKENAVFTRSTPDGGILLWAGSRNEEPAPIAALRLKARAEAYEEYRRLLYVGLTRAKERLYIAGARVGPKPKPDADPKILPMMERSWHAMVEETMGHASEVECIARDGGQSTVLRWQPSAPLYAVRPRELGVSVQARRRTLIHHPLEQIGIMASEPERRVPAMRDDDPRLRGIMMHRVFQYLPDVAPKLRVEAGLAILRQEDCPSPIESQRAWVQEVIELMAEPDLGVFFGTGSRAEVTLAGQVTLANGKAVPLTRRIDRLAVSETKVAFLDLKTGRRPPDGPGQDILTQLTLYARLLADLFPQKAIEATLLWLHDKQIEPVAAVDLDAHFKTISNA
ncbi:RecB ATP-dependent exoDNAse (exonuclease V) beta subunit (contains helicase and exonuclease domains) [Rhabdaerophilaceae bacterium]